MPDSLEKLLAADLTRVAWLPRLPTETLKGLNISRTAISELPGSLLRLEELECCDTPIQRLPAMSSCQQLYLLGCEQLQQLPEQLPAGLTYLDCRGCSVLQQLPAQLPLVLETLYVDGCTTLERLPELPPTLKWLSCKRCSSLRHLPDFSKCPTMQTVSLEGCDGITRCIALQEVHAGGLTLRGG